MRLNADTCQRCLPISFLFPCMTTWKYLSASLIIHTITFDQGYEYGTIAKNNPGAPTSSSVKGDINLQFMAERGGHSSVNGRASSGAT